MENLNFPQDITPYACFIRRQQQVETNRMQFPSTYINPAWQIPAQTNPKYAYVKRSCISDEKYDKLCKQTSFRAKASTVLINPHFKQTVHINPNFKPPLVQKPSSIHVNPKILNQIILNNRALEPVVVRKVAEDSSNRLPQTPTPSIKVCPPQLPNAQRVRRLSLRTKYKIVSSSSPSKMKSSITPIPKKPQTSKYKVDHRLSLRKKKVSPKRVIMGNKLVWRKVTVSPRKLINKRNNESVQVVLSKKSTNKTQKAQIKTVRLSRTYKVVSINNQRYMLNPQGKTLKRLVSKDGSTNVRKIKSRVLNANVINSKSSSRNTRIRTTSSIPVRSRLRKNNIPCPFYCRFGKCSSYDKGSCRRVHDPKLIAVCKKFLQGDCNVKDCPLSHNTSLTKMPTCKYYLDGFCSKDKCLYLHVKLNEKVEICKDFLQGFCEAADLCNKRHLNLCPNMERDGKCTKIKCPYPHKSTPIGKKSYTYLNPNQPSKVSATAKIPIISNGPERVDTEIKLHHTVENSRYYIDTGNEYYKSHNNSGTLTAPASSIELVIPKIPRPNVLPDFIPFS